jgi:trk system potassium uptake protein TrkH
MDIIGENSLCDYATNPIINGVTSALIILGGLGYIVWWDLLRVIRLAWERRSLRALSHLTLHSKLALSATAVLLLGGAVIFLLCEYRNPATIGDMGFFDQLQVSFFQSVTTRTAGFMTVSQTDLTTASTAVSLILMFIGGSPVGTAGGIKTVTVLILAAYALSTVQGRDEVAVFNRRIPDDALRRSVAVAGTSFLIAVLATVILAILTPGRDLADILYETISATATVGLSRDLTPTLTAAGKLTVAVTMYLGRVGPISLAIAFGTRRKTVNAVKNPTEQVSVG